MNAKENVLVLKTELEAAKVLGVSPRTLQKWRVYGNGPVFVRLSARAIRYREADLLAFINQNRRRSTSDFEAGGVV